MSKNGSLIASEILIVDDEEDIRDLISGILADEGYATRTAGDSESALAALRQRRPQLVVLDIWLQGSKLDGIEVLAKERVDIVITDINMPKMDGYGVIRHMRADAAHKSTPVLVLTTESEVEKRNLAREAGATGWMVKPFDPDRLIATINKVAP